jgi:hypothetical protein
VIVKRLYTVVAFLLMVCWAPITAHCSLEKLPGLKFLQCAGDSNSADCEGDSCASVESGFYKIQDHPELTISFTSLPLKFVAASIDQVFKPLLLSAPKLTVAPPELSQSWQFAFRAVLPVRAPSLLS